jgi:hypothetical protein
MASTIFELEWIYLERCLDDLTFNPISSPYQPLPPNIIYAHSYCMLLLLLSLTALFPVQDVYFWVVLRHILMLPAHTF